jgi:hypothetical protein
VIGLSDITKLLEQWPTWKALVALPARIAALEARVAALEAGNPGPGQMPCAFCGATLRVTAETPHPQFGVFGRKVLTMHCDGCGRDTTREFDPAK